METKNLFGLGLIVFLLGVVVGIAILYSINIFKDLGGSSSGGYACPAMAVQCPDGSYGGLSGPNCQPTCPDGVTTLPVRAMPVTGSASSGGAPITCPTGYYADVANPDQGWQCFPNGTLHTL